MKQLFKIFISIVFFVCLGILLSGCHSASPVEFKPGPDFILRAGVAPRPPFVYRNEKKQLAGLDIVLLKLLAEKNDLKLEISEYPMHEIIFALRRGEIDLIAGGFTAAEIKTNFLTPCAHHMKTGQRVIVNNEVAPFITLKEQLDNDKVTIFTVAGSTSAEKVEEIFPNAASVSLKNSENCLKKIKNGKGNVFMLDASDAQFIANDKDSGTALVLGVLSEENIAWATRRKEKKWQEYLNKFMLSLRKNGKLTEIIETTDAESINQ